MNNQINNHYNFLYEKWFLTHQFITKNLNKVSLAVGAIWGMISLEGHTLIIPEGDKRLFVSNKHILEYYKDKNKNSKLIEVAQHQPELDAPGTVYIVSRKADLPLLPNKYKGQNRYQLSHFAVAIKIDDQIHVFEKVSNQANKSKPFVKSYTLDEMNQKCRDKKRKEFNLIIPVGECHSDIKEILNRRGSSN